MSEPKLLITGVPRVQSDPVPRLELYDFVHPNNIKQYSLYIQALQDLYGRDSNKVASYFQMSGVHGKPKISWNQAPIPTQLYGYCVHGTPRFATWHRPYVVLIEQEIQKIAVGLANQYPESEKADWIKAAQLLRQPYWAWDADATMTPPDAVLISQEVEIIKPKVGKVKVSNPFYLYGFPPGIPEKYFDNGFERRHVTLRVPSSDTQSNPNRIKDFFKDSRNRDDIKNRVINTLSAANWKDFTRILENVHGSLHVDIGGFGELGVPAGHMSEVPYAGFDPIFWAHHCQVDRLIQVWYDRKKLWERGNDDLTPFWNTDKTFWKSIPITNPDTTFNYTYPPMQPPTPQSNLLSFAATDSPVSPDSVSDAYNWSVCITAKKFELGGSFTVFVFVGKVPASPDNWLTDPSYAGKFSFFVNTQPEHCENCTTQADAIVEDYVVLNRNLKRAGLESLEPDIVSDFLKKKEGSEWVNLNWAISTTNCQIILENDLEKYLPSLEMWVGYTTGLREGKGMIPETYLADITRGRPGGAKGE